jgi:AcrR family transcriptional regulator
MRKAKRSENPDARFKHSRNRILNAAREELVRYGAAGARINRIAEAAGTSKERMYAYFRNKADLVDAVMQERHRQVDQATQFDAMDLLGYMGRLFDFYASNPDDVRLSQWLALDKTLSILDASDPRIVSLKQRMELIREAQRAGLIDAHWEPLTLLNLLVGLALSWATAPQFVHQIDPWIGKRTQMQMRRQAVIEAARRLVSAADKASG